MPVTFSNSIYLQSIKNKYQIKDERQIFEDGKKFRRFAYRKVTFIEYSKIKGKRPRFIGLRLVAAVVSIPVFLLVAVYNLALAIFKGIPKAMFREFSCLKSSSFSVVRWLEAASGSLLSVFSPTLGNYLIEEGLFHVSYYRSFSPRAKFQPRAEKPKVNFHRRPDFRNNFTNFWNRDSFSWGNRREHKPSRDEFYRTLGLERSASFAEIKKKYQSWLVKNHPDKHNTAETEVRREKTKAFQYMDPIYKQIVEENS